MACEIYYQLSRETWGHWSLITQVPLRPLLNIRVKFIIYHFPEKSLFINQEVIHFNWEVSCFIFYFLKNYWVNALWAWWYIFLYTSNRVCKILSTVVQSVTSDLTALVQKISNVYLRRNRCMEFINSLSISVWWVMQMERRSLEKAFCGWRTAWASVTKMHLFSWNRGDITRVGQYHIQERVTKLRSLNFILQIKAKHGK